MEQKEIIEIIKNLTEIFKIERYAYLAIAIISFGILTSLSIYSFLNNAITFEYFMSLFLPSGAIALSGYGILKMWNDAIKMLQNPNNSTD